MNATNVLSKIKLSLNRLPVYKYRYYWFLVPAVILFLAVTLGAIYSAPGVFGDFANIGIDFEGGTVMTVSGLNLNNYDADRNTINDVLTANGISVSSWQTSGNNSIVVRYANYVNGEDYNERAEEMGVINNNAVTQIHDALMASGRYNGATLEVNPEMINGTARQDTINSSLIAVAVAMALMLIYTAIRFDLFSGIAALCTQFIDVIVTLSLVIIFRVSINASLIAALITVVAYSINNTIVIFDRVRENMAPYKHKDKTKADIPNILETSVTQCLRRALFTTTTTLITIVILAFFGINIPSLSEFALPIIFGILSGLFSSVFLAPSIWGMLMDLKNRQSTKKAKSKRR